MDWLTLGIIAGCAMMFIIALVWRQYKIRLKADEHARDNAQKIIDGIAEKEKKKQVNKTAQKRKDKK